MEYKKPLNTMAERMENVAFWTGNVPPNSIYYRFHPAKHGTTTGASALWLRLLRHPIALYYLPTHPCTYSSSALLTPPHN